jgi:hypothetical protein
MLTMLTIDKLDATADIYTIAIRIAQRANNVGPHECDWTSKMDHTVVTTLMRQIKYIIYVLSSETDCTKVLRLVPSLLSFHIVPI